jgi:hypothetical protein
MTKWIATTVLVALLHITPTVVLVKRPDAVKTLLPRAATFVAREIHLSNADAHRLHAAVDWSPDDGVLTFYTGFEGDRTAGTLVFVRVDTPHGPLEVAVGMSPAAVVAGVIVTKATVETKPWVLEALQAGLCEHYRGLRPTDVPAGARAIEDHVGQLPLYVAREVDKGVARALAALEAFYII